ncbi:RNA-binding cell elongation regulator Jag/EloR [Lacticaseibacillus zhaodongensis]|uniref:RNA-binding cell elongation regulator Jag/EloR n=1 Tax=Lacticaseibacillus zhaodongensis TaxID=2668065 RepID=UPI0012D2A0E6|nr:RNA-binding cell elongation regulator Jag/EloR [Lacticaseibacillus zhaodongensis]
MPTFEGKTIETAIDTGLLTLGVPRAAVRIDVLSEGRHGFLGIGAKPAQVRITIKEAVSDAAKAAGMDPQATAEEATVAAENAPQAANMAKGSADEAATDTTGTSKPVRSNEAGLAAVQNYLEQSITALGIKVTVTQHKVRGGVQFDLAADKDALLIGKHGKTINALQFLAQTLFNHRGRSKWIITLNVGDYRQRRQQILQRLAQKSAREVIATGKPVYLDPMPSFERKIMHQELSDNEFVETRSEGVDPHRYVIVAPKR